MTCHSLTLLEGVIDDLIITYLGNFKVGEIRAHATVNGVNWGRKEYAGKSWFYFIFFCFCVDGVLTGLLGYRWVDQGVGWVGFWALVYLLGLFLGLKVNRF